MPVDYDKLIDEDLAAQAPNPVSGLGSVATDTFGTYQNPVPKLSEPIAPPGPGPVDYDKLIDEDIAAQEAARNTILDLAIPKNPDKVARSQELAKRYKVRVEAVDAEFDLIDRKARVEDLKDMARESPILLQKLTDPTFVDVAHDDVGVLAGVEKGLRLFGGSLAAGLTGGAYYKAIAGVLDVGSEAVTKPLVEAGVLPEDFLGRAAGELREYGKTSDAVAQYLRGDQQDLSETALAALGGVESFSSLVTGLVASVITGNPTPILGLAGTQEFGRSTQAAHEKGLTPAQSAAYGLLNAGVEVGTEMLPAFTLLRDIKLGSGLVKTVLHQLAAEVPQEQLATFLQDFNEFVILRPEATLAEFVEERPSAAWQTLVATGTAVGLQTSAAHGVAKLSEKFGKVKETTDQNTEALKQLLELDSKTAKRAPQVFSQFVTELTEGGVDSVYVDAAVLQQQAQEGKVDLTKSMPETASQLQDALDMQGAVRIPLGEFVTALQGTPLAQSLLPMVRIGDANAPTQQELSDGKWAEETRVETEKIMAASGFDTAWRESAATVEREFQTQSQTANRFTSDVNNANARAMATSYAVLAARLKATGKPEYADLTPALAYAKWRINIAAEQPVAGQKLEQPTSREDGSTYDSQTGRWNDPAVLNVGLAASEKMGGLAPTVEEITAALGEIGVKVLRSETLRSRTEETFVPTLSRPLTKDELRALSVRLRQEAISQRTGKGVGMLEGPHAELWGGVYKDEYFQSPGGPPNTAPERAPVPRAQGVPTTAFSISTARDTTALKGHPDYAAAKSGDLEAAVRLVSDLVRPEDLAAAREKFGEGAVYAYPQAEEATGRNAIPGVLANYYAENTGGTVEENIVQTNRAFHTGAKMMERMLSRPQFEGAVVPGRYVVVDDVSLSGSTLAELAGHIRQQGSEVIGTITLTDASRAGTITPDQKAISLIEERFGDEIERTFGVPPDALTAEEANYLVNFRDVDALRVSVATAKQARAERLRAKGVQAGALAGATITGVHYSQAPRPVLDGRFAGTGIKAQERKRLDQSTDPRIRDRVDFYVGEHRREPGLGSFRHDVELHNMYDGAKNPLSIPSKDFNAFESAVIDAGFDGYYTKGRAVLLGAASHNVKTPVALRQEIAADKRLPDAMLTPDEWASVLATKAPDLYARIPTGALDSLPRVPVNKYGLLFQQQRASLTIPSDPNEPMTIALMKAADLSSFHHEGAHGFLEIMSRIAALPDAPVEIVEDMNKALKWFGIKGDEDVAPGEKGGVVAQATQKGFDGSKAAGKVYHGTDQPIETFDFSRASIEGAVFFTDDPTAAANYSKGFGKRYKPGSNIIPAYINLQNPLEVDYYGEGDNDLLYDVEQAKEDGHDGLIARNVFDGKRTNTQYVVFRNDQIRSAISGELMQDGEPTPPTGDLPKGRTALEVWNAMSLDQKRPYHEQWARGYEMLLFEGKAPSIELDGLFARFRSWMVNVYRSLQGIKDAYTQQTGLVLPDLTDEMRGVYGRLLATDEQIKAAENARGYAPLFSTKPIGMTEDEWVTYQKTDPEATQEAVATLQTRGLRDMQWLSNARSRALKKLQKGAAEKRKAVRAEVADEVLAQPIYRAMEFLKRGVLDGEQLTGAKLSLPALKEMYGDGPNAPWRHFPTGKYSMVATEGLHPDQAAEILGFTSGDQLVRQLLEAEPARAVIAGMTDQRMLERYGDMADPASIERAANMAIHNDARGRFIATEANALAKATGRRRLLATAAKSAAEAMIARTRVRDLRPAQYEAAEARAGRAAEKAFGKDLVEAATQKRTQLANHYAARAAYEAVEETEEKLAHLKKLGTSGARKNMRGEFLEQLDAFLERFDLRTSTTRKKTATERVALKDWLVAEAERLGAVMPDISEEMLDERTRKSYKDMTVEELRGVFDTVRQLEHLARREQKMYTTLRNLNYHAEVSAILEDFKNAYPQAFDAEGPLPYDKSYAPKLADLAEKMRSQFDGEFVNPENLLSVLTLDKGRQALASLFGRLSNASDAHMAYMKRLATHLAPAADAYTFKERRAFYSKGIPVAELGGREFTKNAITSIALYWGSADGRQRIQDGFGWNETQVTAILDKLDQKDWNFVDALWRMSDEMIWPDLKTLNERTKGIAPPKVEAMPYTTKFGEARGGYAPLVYDGEVDSRSQSLNNDDAVHELLGGTARQAGTRQSASKARVEKVTRKLDLSLSAFTYKINETVHDITHREAVADTWRLLQSNRIGNAVRTIGGPPVLEALKRRVRETAVKPIVPTGFTTKALWLLRRNTLINMMGMSFNTIAINVLGTAPAMREVGPVRFARAAAKFANPATAGKYFGFIMEKSQYMVHRPMGFDRDMNTEMSRFTTKATIMPSMATWFVGLAMMDRAVTLPTWLAAYEKHMEEGPVPNDIDASVEAADRAVRRTQGGGRKIDLADIAGGTGAAGEFKHLITMYYNFFSAQLGQMVLSQRIAKAQFNEGQRAKAAVNLTLATLSVVVIPAVLEALARGTCDESADPAEWAGCLTRQSVFFTANFVPLARDVIPFAWSKFDPEVINFGVRLSPVVNALEALGGAPKAMYDFGQGEANESDYRTLVRGTGYAFGLPGFQAWRTLDGYRALVEGESDDLTDLLTGPGYKK